MHLLAMGLVSSPPPPPPPPSQQQQWFTVTVNKLEVYKKVCRAPMFFLYNLQKGYPNKGILQRYNFMNVD
jgi:hypothetical protein